MNPESLVLQPKVTEVRCLEQAGLWLQLSNSPVGNKHHTRAGGPAYHSWLGSSRCPASVWLPDESIRLLQCSSVGADTLKCCKCGLTNTETHALILTCVYYHRDISCCNLTFPLTTAAVHFSSSPPSAFSQGHRITNCCSCSVTVTVCNGQICANLPVASVFFFPSLSLCRFTLIYRELIL